MIFGYARVSTVEQDTQLQFDALLRYGCDVVYSEKTSSVGKRPELQRLLSQLKPDDKLVVYKLDRLARSLKDLLSIVDRLEVAGAAFHSLTESFDTSSASGRMMMQMLGAVAEFERSLIRERSIAGQQLAKSRGVHCGRKRALDPESELRLIRTYNNGYRTMPSLAHEFGVSLSVVKRTIYRQHKPTSSCLL
jgi:DNA invertase Pin-like site-specific DNA recombinase